MPGHTTPLMFGGQDISAVFIFEFSMEKRRAWDLGVHRMPVAIEIEAVRSFKIRNVNRGCTVYFSRSWYKIIAQRGRMMRFWSALAGSRRHGQSKSETTFQNVKQPCGCRLYVWGTTTGQVLTSGSVPGGIFTY